MKSDFGTNIQSTLGFLFLFSLFVFVFGVCVCTPVSQHSIVCYVVVLYHFVHTFDC